MFVACVDRPFESLKGIEYFGKPPSIEKPRKDRQPLIEKGQGQHDHRHHRRKTGKNRENDGEIIARDVEAARGIPHFSLPTLALPLVFAGHFRDRNPTPEPRRFKLVFPRKDGRGAIENAGI